MNEKEVAGYKAIEEIEDGMTVGLGTGSTVYYFLKALSEKIDDHFSVTCVATSKRTADLAISWEIPVYPFNSVKKIDISVDGADEIDPHLNGIKGGGGALLYEKIVAKSSAKIIWVVGSNKLKKQLGQSPLPIEVIPFGWKRVENLMREKGYNPELRLGDNGQPFVTDAQHYILDLHLNKIEDPNALADELDHITGIVEHGLFLDMTEKVIIGYSDGHVQILENNPIDPAGVHYSNSSQQDVIPFA